MDNVFFSIKRRLLVSGSRSVNLPHTAAVKIASLAVGERGPTHPAPSLRSVPVIPYGWIRFHARG
jgi:hypothetical protein